MMRFVFLLLFFIRSIISYAESDAFNHIQTRKIEDQTLSIQIDESFEKGFKDKICSDLKSFLSKEKKKLAPFQKVECLDFKESLWSLEIKEADDKISLYFFQKFKKQKRLFGRIDLPAKEKSHEALSDQFMSFLISIWVKDLMPFSFSVASQMLDKEILLKDYNHTYTKAYQIPYPPRSLKIYSAKIDPKDGYIFAEEVAHANLVEEKEKQEDQDQKDHSKKDKQNHFLKEIKWKIEKTSEDAFKNKGLLWAQNGDGSSVFKKRIVTTIETFYNDKTTETTKLFSKLATSLGGLFLDTLSFGYLGVRYGLAAIKSAKDPFISDMRFFGLLAEFRTGLFKGFNFNLDLWPSLVETFYGQAAEFGGHRIVFGYKFLFNIDFLFTNFHMTPKAGLWTFKTAVPVDFEDGTGDVVKFQVNNDLSLGITTGFEIVDENRMIDLWLSSTVSIPPTSSQIPDASSVSATKVGIDAFYGVGLFDLFGLKMKPSLLGFAFFEATKIVKSSASKKGLDENSDYVNNFGFKQAFYGLGLAISW